MLLALAAPVLTLTLGTAQLSGVASTSPASQALTTAVSEGLPAGVMRPTEVIVARDNVEVTLDRLRTVDGVAAAVAPKADGWRANDHALIQVWSKADPASGAGRATLKRVRAVADQGSVGDASVGGTPAEDADFISAVYGHAVWVVLGVAIVTFLLLARALRSLWLPVKALALNALSLGAAYGVTVLIWQNGYGSDLLFGQAASGVVTIWVPIAAFAFLFGLSMDYEVFLLSRMREEHDRLVSPDAGEGLDEHIATDRAVVESIANTGRLVTSAALILFLAFIALSTVPTVEVKVLATTLAFGIAIDALIVRGLLAPALVGVLGRANWTMPRWLAKVLRLSAAHPGSHAEGATPPQAATPAVSAPSFTGGTRTESAPASSGARAAESRGTPRDGLPPPGEPGTHLAVGDTTWPMNVVRRGVPVLEPLTPPVPQGIPHRWVRADPARTLEPPRDLPHDVRHTGGLSRRRATHRLPAVPLGPQIRCHLAAQQHPVGGMAVGHGAAVIPGNWGADRMYCRGMLSALVWGAIAASSLTAGALLALLRDWRAGLVGGVLSFGAGALISSVAFELAQHGLKLGGPKPVAIGLALGALAFFVADRAVSKIGGRSGGGSGGLPLALGALLDGIPEQAVLGIGLATGKGVSVALLVAIFISNLPEAIGSASDMRKSGKPSKDVMSLWAVVTVVCALATLGGYAIAQGVGGQVKAGIDGFAAGALLVMLVDSMIPEAKKKAGNIAGLVTVLGFAVAAGLSNLS